MARSTSISPGPGLTLRGSLHRACLIHQHGASAPSRSTAAHRIGQIAAKPGWEEAVERIGKCHCGSFRVIGMGEPDRVYLCNCKACQRRPGTVAFTGHMMDRPERVVPRFPREAVARVAARIASELEALGAT